MSVSSGFPVGKMKGVGAVGRISCTVRSSSCTSEKPSAKSVNVNVGAAAPCSFVTGVIVNTSLPSIVAVYKSVDAGAMLQLGWSAKRLCGRRL